MLRTLLLALFLLIDLGCVSVVYSQQNNHQVIHPQISSTTDEVPTDVSDDTPTDLILTSSTTTETIENNTNNVEFDMTSINCDINNFDYVPYSNRINVSWDDCGSNYDVDIVKAVYEGPEIPQFRRLSDSSSYQFKKLEECTAYNISIETDYGFPYRTTIRTLPDTIENLQMLIQDDTINLNWSEPLSEDCRTYQLTLNDETPQNLVENSFSTPYSTTNCTRIEIGLMDNENKTGEITTREVPGLVQKLEAEFGNHSIMATWSEPFDETCVTGYKLALNGTTIQNPTTETEYNFTGLESCTQYTVGVAAFSNSDDGKFSEVTGTTIAPTIIRAVQNLKSQLLDDTLRTTWDPPALQGACITEYGLEIWGYGATVGATTTNTTYDITPAVGCRQYSVQVIPKIGVQQGVSTIVETTIPAKINEPPTLVSVNPAKTSSTINLKLESQASNFCTITDIIVNCTAEGNEPYDWIVEDALEEDDYTDIVARTATVVVEDISEFTNYTCYAYVENEAGRSEASDAINFTTLQEVPSSPEDITYQEHENGVLIMWDAPAKIPGILRNYSLVISDGEPLHYIPEECNITVLDFNYETSESFFLFSQRLPSFEYTVTVSASTDAGYGEGATITMKTSYDAPEAPRDVITELLNETGETYNVKLIVTWLSPCNTNGKLHHFRWELYGESLDDYYIDTQEKVVNANPSENDTYYEIIVTNIEPFHNYTFKLTAYSGESTEYLGGEDFVYRFISPDGFSSAPEGLNVTNITSDSAVISWGEPSTKNGEILSYRISINTTGPDQYVPPNCTLDYETFYNYTTEVTTLSYVFDKGLPNFHYIVSVAAVTIAGYGAERTIEFTTASAVPSLPRNVDLVIHNVLGKVYRVLVIISWYLPCNLNGELTYFPWTLDGTSLETGVLFNDSGLVFQNGYKKNDFYELTLNDIKPMFNYTFSLNVCVSNGDICGPSYVSDFLSPDGYPSPPFNVTVKNMTAYSGVLVWDEPLNKNGKILSYQVNIVSNGPAHFIPEDCNLEDEPSHYLTVNSTTFEYAFEALPHYKYRAVVVASTRAGYGYEELFEFVHSSRQSQPPREVGYALNNVLGEIYNVTLDINFLLPCNTNGKLINFLWTLVGNSSEDFSTYTNSGLISPNKDELDTYYVETIPNLRPLHNYQLSIAAVVGDAEQIIGEEFTTQFDSPDGIPTAPLNLTVTDLSADFGTIIWEEPMNKNGKLQKYRLIVTSSGPTYTLPQGCTISYNPLVYNVTVDAEMRNYAIRGTPNFYYNATLAASTRNDYGPETTYSFTTLGAAPQELKNIKMNITNTKTENYLSYVMISFDKPCELNGLFDHYAVEISGDRDGFMIDDHVFVIDSYAGNSFKLNLNPQHSYYGYIDLYTTSFHSRISITNFTAPAGVPPSSKLLLDPPILTPTSAALELNDQLFDNTQGDIMYYAIIVKAVTDLSEELGGSYDFWELPSWPAFGSWSNSGTHTEYQTTPAFWNPFEDIRTTNLTYVVGNGNCTSRDTTYCNGPLKPNTQYAIRIRGFTANAYRDTDVVYFTTPSDETYLALILGLIFGILTALLLLIFIFLLWRKKRKNKEEDNEEVTVIQSSKPPPIPKNKFAEHCRLFEEDRSQLKAEYSHLDRLSATEKPSSNVAMADNNKRKNRYINIMPYDDTRVKLTTDNNDNYEDYINASYIKGYSGNPEYIATQGPMGTTVEDFWKMIVQEDVGIIVMVAQFIEQSKQKCFKYFPEKEEIMHVGTDINVKCTSEANLNDYFTRTLIVEKDGEQKVVKHLQYMLWPDFGCPTNTNSMLEFREIMRKHIENTKNKAVVHCSAGVGRTGTLIAIDILLQKIDNSRDDVDVFGTVLDLRRQRTHMVQTEKQYEYIHKCLRDYLITPKQITDDESPIYENINIINGYTDITRMNGGHVSTENLIKLKEL